MIKAQGTTLFPQSIYSCLDEMHEIVEYYIEVTGGFDLSDVVTVHAAVSSPDCGVREIEDRLQAALRMKPNVVIDPEADVKKTVFTTNARKPVRFIDRRDNIDEI